MTTTASILSVGAAFGRHRLDAATVAAAWGRTAKPGAQASVCAPDEDVLTLAWDAAGAALRAAGVEPGSVDGLWWGTTRPPFADGPSHSLLATAIGLRDDTIGALLSGSPHAGVDALVAAAHAVGAGAARTALVVAADVPVPGPGGSSEARAGAGAVAMVLTAGRGAAQISVERTWTRPVLDRYRGDGEATTRDHYDGRLFRDQVLLPLAAEAAPGHALDRWSVHDPDGRAGRAVGQAVGATEVTSAAVEAAVGDTGAAAALLGWLPAATETGRAGILAWGGGRATVLLAEASEPVPGADISALLAGGHEIDYPTALRARGLLVAAGEPVPMGVPPGSAMLLRETTDLVQLAGARCVDCGNIATPPAIHPSCPSCGGPKLERVPLARTGRVHTYVVNHTMPAPFEAPLPLLVVDLDDGARLAVQGVGDGSDIEIDRPVELVLRRYAVERGVPVYGYKARAVPGGGDRS